MFIYNFLDQTMAYFMTGTVEAAKAPRFFNIYF